MFPWVIISSYCWHTTSGRNSGLWCPGDRPPSASSPRSLRDSLPGSPRQSFEGAQAERIWHFWETWGGTPHVGSGVHGHVLWYHLISFSTSGLNQKNGFKIASIVSFNINMQEKRVILYKIVQTSSKDCCFAMHPDQYWCKGHICTQNDMWLHLVHACAGLEHRGSWTS